MMKYTQLGHRILFLTKSIAIRARSLSSSHSSVSPLILREREALRSEKSDAAKCASIGTSRVKRSDTSESAVKGVGFTMALGVMVSNSAALGTD